MDYRQSFRNQVEEQFSRWIADLISPSPLVASMRAQVEDAISPSPLKASLLARIADAQHTKEQLKYGGFSFTQEFQI